MVQFVRDIGGPIASETLRRQVGSPVAESLIAIEMMLASRRHDCTDTEKAVTMAHRDRPRLPKHAEPGQITSLEPPGRRLVLVRRTQSVAVLIVAIPALLSASTSTAGRDPSHPGFTNAQYADAVAIARREGETGFHKVLAATATIEPGKVSSNDSNTGHACTSGTVLKIQVTGEDPKFFTDAPVQDRIQAIEIILDASTDLPCLEGVRPHHVTTDPGATVLFTG